MSMLTARLDEARRALDAGEEIDPAAVEALLAEVRPAAASLSHAELVLLKEAVDRLTERVAAERERLAEDIGRLGEGRRGNRGYGQLKGSRQGQRLYRRA